MHAAAGSREYEDAVNRVAPDVGYFNPGVGGHKDRSAGVHFPHLIAQADACAPVLQKDNLVCARVCVSIDLPSYRNVLRQENQLRRATVVPIDLEDKTGQDGRRSQHAT